MKIRFLSFIILLLLPYAAWSQAAASANYATQTGTLGTNYSWIDCSSGTSIVTGDDAQASFLWPFSFSFYDNTYTTANSLSIATNGFIRLDGTAATDYSTASSFSLASSSTGLGQIIAASVYDCNIGGIESSWVKYLVTGSAPNRILTIEFNDIEIDYNDGLYADVQVSFYETTNIVVLKSGTDNVTATGADMGIHSGVSGYFNKWQEVSSGANNAWIEYTPTAILPPSGPAASWNYNVQTGTTGSTYSWIDCSSGSSIVTGDDAQAQINWPFNFNFYDNIYTTSNSLSVATNGFIRLDDVATTSYSSASAYTLSNTSTELGQIIAIAVYDDKVGDNSGWVRSLVTGTAPNRIFTIEYNNLEISYNAGRYADVQVSFYESSNKIVLKSGTDNVTQAGADMGIHSGVSDYYNKWQEVASGTSNTWIEYTPDYIEVNATIGTLTSYYPTLKSAFDKINDGTHRGAITIKIKSNTTETASAVLNASGAGSASYTSVRIYPTVSGISISGNLASPLIDLNGADNVTIDGRPNASGSAKDLTINNTSTSATSGTSAIRFVNDASSNTVKYCTIKGSGVSTDGIIFFSTTTGSSGNDANIIDNNNITNSADANRPVNAVYSLGTSGKDNSGNTISNNNIYDFLRPGSNSNGIYLTANTNEWTIDGNSFYETSSFTSTGTFTYCVIQINNVSGNGFQVLNNYIGGTSAQCGGTSWTKTNSKSNPFNAISLNVGTTTTSSVQNNTIQSFNWNNLTNDAWTAINITAGSVNIGTTTGNTIGAATGTGSVSITGSTIGQHVYGINIAGNGTVNCANNIIGSFIVANTNSAYPSHFTGINTSCTGTNTFSNNTIGSLSQANSIAATSTSTSFAQSVYGIRNTAAAIITIDNNTIANLTNATTNTSSSTTGLISGITSGAGINLITNNKIYNLSIANANTASSGSASVSGIAVASTNTINTISTNTIYNLSNLYNSFAGSVIGLYFGSSGTSNTVTANFIYDLSISGSLATNASIYGIKINTGQTTYANNIISLGGNTANTIYGIYESGTSVNNNSIYFNTVYISGSLGAGITNQSYALYSNATTNVRDFRNNVFMNARSTTSGSNLHYAAYFNYSISTNITLNYNDYFVSGTGGVLGFYGGVNKTTLPLVTGQDANSLNVDPNFTTPGGTVFSDYITFTALPGVFGTGILTDYEVITRNNPPKMGALESSLGFIWQGNVSTDFANAANWLNGAVPNDGNDISFAALPVNDCYLDQNRSVKQITNASDKKLVVNGKQLTITGSIVSATTNQLDATVSSSVVIFAGTTAQLIPSGAFVGNTIDGLALNNINGLAQNGAITVQTSLTLTSGAYIIGANTLTLNGSVSATSGSLTGGSSANISVGGNGAGTTLPSVSVNNLTLNRANGIALGGNVSVGGELTLTNGSLVVGSSTFTIAANTITRTSGNIDATGTSGTIVFLNSSAITLPVSLFSGLTLQNLTISGGGITANENMTVNGVLNLQSANPSAIKGLLDMSSPYELVMGENSTTTGTGDVTGIISRYAFVAGQSYSFGNKNTRATFNPGATLLPDFLKLKVVIGSTPWWRSGAIERVYDLIQSGGENCIATLRAFYLNTELNGNAEDKLSLWSQHNNIPPYTTPLDNGRSVYNLTENWMELSDINLMYFPPAFGYFELSLDETELTYHTWTGLVDTDWKTAANWSPMSVPSAVSYILIPDATTTSNDPTLPANENTEIMSISIEPEGILNSGSSDNAQLSLTHNIATWSNNGGTFNPGNSTINFIRDGNSTISGTTTFNNIYISDITIVTMAANSYIKVAGAITINEASELRGVLRTEISGATTVEYNGGDQTVVIPNTSSNSYHSLVLSGSGIKTMPVTALTIIGEFVLSGTASATAAAALTVDNEIKIQDGATFATGNFDHTVGGHFENSGSFIPSEGTTITMNGTVVQNIIGTTPTSFGNLTVNNPAGIDIFTDITVNNTLTLVNGNLNTGTTTLTINGDVSKTSGYINVGTLSSLYFGGTTLLTTADDLFATTPAINNLTINRTGGVAFGSDITVNGILNLISTNPTAFRGSLDMGTYTLHMGAAATTTGAGDVTGSVKRTTILPDVEYTFGNQFSSVTFPNVGTIPTEITLKISIGSAPTWKTDGIKRIYDISQIGGNGTKAIMKSHYLDSELNGNAEVNLSFFSYVYPDATLLDRGLTQLNISDNWITLNNADFGNLSSAFGVVEHGFGVSTSDVITWDGSESTDWSDQYNWTPAYSPDADKTVIIPDAATTVNDPTIANSSSSSVNKLTIQPGGILNAGAGSQLTIFGTSGAWSNSGTFNAGTGKVIFNSGIPSEIVTIAGITEFYNIEVGLNTTMQPVAGSTLRIAGAGTANTTSVIDFSTIENTVEWNGADQSIVVPNGIGGNRGYYNLILSGSGTKTLPEGEMLVKGSFSTSGTINATAAASFTVLGNITIGNGTAVTSGAFSHYLSGNFQNNGTFNATAGGNMIFNGSSAQIISGTTTTDFDNLTVNNLLGVALASNINVNNVLTFTNGTLSIGANTLRINGTISNPSGNIGVSTSSNLIFGGTAALTVNNDLFSTVPSINNLTINRAGGVTLGNQSITVNGVLDLQVGILSLAANTLTIAGSAPIRTSGSINAVSSGATLAFTNAAVITLPANLITGNVNNLTVNGAGINASGDLTINGVLSLLGANQSANTGSLNMSAYTLNMGATATTTGTSDVTGIVRREHTFINGVEYSFGNQFTSLNFLGVPGGIKPSWISCKIEIGTAPSWRSEALNRFYSFAQSGGTDRMIVKLHYLDSELHDAETDETQLVYWDAYDPDLTAPYAYTSYPRNHNVTDASNNWIQLTGPAINYLATSSTFDVKQWGLSYSNVAVHTWIGLGSVSYPGDWSLPGHWDGGVPQADNDVLIPETLPVGNSGYPYRNLLSATSPASAQTIEIETGASLGVTDSDITVYGDGDAWVNNGSFTPGTGNVIFANGDESQIVTISGTTNFNNLTITDKTHFHLATGSITRVAGILNASSGAVLDFTTNANLVEYNGNSGQAVINPTGDANPGYHDLIFSGNGTKTLPASTLNIEGNFTTNAAVSASGNTLVMSGTDAQSITGTVAPALNNFSISNVTSTVTAGVNIACSGNFTNSGDFDMTTYALAVASTVNNTGTVKTASVSASPLPSGKTWGGTAQYYTTSGGQTVMAGTYNNLTLSNTSGTQTASGNLSVNATLITTTGGVLNMGANQLLGTLSTITNGGTIQTQNTSATPVPASKTWGGTVQYNALTGGQTTMTGIYNILTLSNTSGTQAASGDITATTFNTVAGGTLNMGINALVLTNLSHSGILRTQNTSSTPFTSGKTWGGTVIFDGTSGQTLPTPSSIFNNLTIGNTSGVTAAANQTVNGILNLSVANPDATHGSLDMSTYTLNLGATANTTGTGDVTGTITRTTFTTNTIYTYGNANQYVFFPVTAGQTLPTSFSLRVTLLATAPSWVPNATKRLYEMAQTGGNATKATFRANYLEAELPGNIDESLLSFWQFVHPFIDPDDVLERGWTDYNSQENWISFSEANLGEIPAALGYFMVAIASSQYEYVTWNGIKGTVDWNTAENWTPSIVPVSSLGIVIPDVDISNDFSPDLPADAQGKYIIIQRNGILNAVTDAAFTLSGNGNVWSTEAGGVFNPGNSVVTFAGDSAAGIVSISGYTDFYDLTISDTTKFRPGVNSYIGIAGLLTNNGVFEAAPVHNTVEFKGDASITIPNPNGATPGYHSLIISGTGTKTLPTPLYLWHDFTNNGTVDAGTGTVTMGTLGTLEGISTNIGGSSPTTFYDLVNNNTSAQLITTANISIGGTFTINAATTFQPGAANTIDGAGTITGSGTARVTRITSTPDMETQYPIANKILTDLTVDYCGAGDQTVSAFNYGNLLFSANGTRTLTLSNSGVIGVSGVFIPEKSSTNYIITGSTLESNGTGSQTMPAFNYYNVIISGDRSGGTITLADADTIGVAGHSTVTASNATFEILNSTININGTEAQTLDPFSFYNVIFSNSGVKTAVGDLIVYGGFVVNSGTTLDMEEFTLSGTFSSVNSNGTVKTANTGSTPIPSGKTWGGTIEYTGTDAQTLVVGTYNNLTMSGAGGGIIAGDLTVNGVLNLLHTNPLSTQGILHTSSNTLSMGASATTTGVGDVTGIVKRQHAFANNIEYSFGNQYTSLNFLGVPGSVKPDWVSCKIEIGSAPVWRTTNVKRIYSFLQSGGTDRTYAKLHYLDTELDEAEPDESKIVMYTDKDGLITGDNTVALGKNSNDGDDNWVELLGMSINQIATSSSVYAKAYGLGYSDVSIITWTGLGAVSYPGDWSLPGNWSGGVPSANDNVLIPAGLSTAYPYRNLLSAIAPANVKTIEIEPDAVVSTYDYDIIVSGDESAWINNGTFNAGTSAVIFNNGSTSNIAEITGTTNFYNLTVGDNTKIQAIAGSIIRIAGALSPGSGSITDFVTNSNTVEYNGTMAQSVVNPGAGYGYYNLIFSGSGTKTLPSSSLSILGDLTVNSAITVAGNTVLMEGTSAQVINGTNGVSLNSLTIDNAAGVTLDTDALTTIREGLLINSDAQFNIAPARKLTVSGTITNNGGVAGLVLKSSVSGTASLIHNTLNVEATAERFISGSAEDWHFISSPVADHEIAPEVPTIPSWVPSGTYGNNTGYDMYLWNEPDNCWIFKLNTTSPVNWTTVHPTANFVAGKGYLYSVQDANPTKEFFGNLNNGELSYPLTNSNSDPELQGFNLIGNPYPSALDWNSIGWTRNNLVENGGGNDMWIWNHEANNYGVYNSSDADGTGTNDVTRYIAPMQGFFVRAAASGDIVMTNTIRVHEGASNWFKNGSESRDKVKVRVEAQNGSGYDEVLLKFGCSSNEPGASKLFSKSPAAPSLYMVNAGKQLTVRYLTDTIDNPSVPVLFNAGEDGDYTLNIDYDYSRFDIVMLEDQKTKTIYNLRTNPQYHFNASTTDTPNRFVIHFAPDPHSIHELPAQIYYNGTDITLDLSLVDENVEVQIVDMLGRVILQKSLEGKSIYNLPAIGGKQVYIINAATKDAAVSCKLYMY